MTASLQKHINDFWKYAKTCGKCADLEDIYIEWANNKNLTLNEFKSAYINIYSSINNLLHSNKTALKIDMDPEEFRSLFSDNSSTPLAQTTEPAFEEPVEDFQELTEPLEEDITPEDTGVENSEDFVQDDSNTVEVPEEESFQNVNEESSFDAFDNEEDTVPDTSNDEIPPSENINTESNETKNTSKLGDSTLLDILGT